MKTELLRISKGKSDLREAINRRGADISDTDTIDTYAKALSKCKYCVTGTFTPGESTSTFSVSGLSFVPTLVYITIERAVAVENTVACYSREKEKTGVLGYINGEMVFESGVIKANTTIDSWTDDGYSVSFPAPFVFLEDMTYKFYLAGEEV